MGFGDFASGFTGAFSNYLTTERQKQRDSEDAEIESRLKILHDYSQSPNFDPAGYATILNDIQTLTAAKGGKGKLKKGTAGMRGEHESPVSQLFSMFKQHLDPASQAQSQGFTGESVVNSPPTPLPPRGMAEDGVNNPRLLDAGHQMQEQVQWGQDSQPAPAPEMPEFKGTPGGGHKGAGLAPPPTTHSAPFMFSNEYMAQQAVEQAKNKSHATQEGNTAADVEALRQAGASEQEIKDFLLHGGRVPVEQKQPLGKNNYTEMVGYDPATGKPFSYVTNSADGQSYKRGPIDPSTGLSTLIPFAPPTDYTRTTISPTNQLVTETDDAGHVSAGSFDKRNPTAGVQSVPIPPTIKGRTSPGGPIVVVPGPSGSPDIYRGSRTGNSAAPVTIPDPNAPAGQNGAPQPRIQARQYKPMPDEMRRSVTAAEQALKMLDMLEAQYTEALSKSPKKSVGFVGPIAGTVAQGQNSRWNIFTEGNVEAGKMQQVLQELNSQIAVARAGLAQTGQELKRIEAITPSMVKQENLFLPNIQQLRQFFNQKLDSLASPAGQAVPVNGQQRQGFTPPPTQKPAVPQNATPGTSGTTSSGLTWTVKGK